MGFDVDAQVIRVLEQGLPPLPATLEPEDTAPVAAWRGVRYGSVLLVRLINDGNDGDADCALAERDESGSWRVVDWGGCPWHHRPFERPDSGPVMWIEVQTRETSLSFEVRDAMAAIARGEPQDVIEAGGEPVIVRVPAGSIDPAAIARQAEETADFNALIASGLTTAVPRLVLGIAPTGVAAIAIEQGGDRRTMPIDSPVGAFVLGIEAAGSATMQPLDPDGGPVGPPQRA